MFLVELLERVTDGFRAAARLAGQSPGDFGGRAAALASRCARRMIIGPLRLAQLAELGRRGAPAPSSARTKRSTELSRKPTRLRPSITKRRLTKP